jgi:hypothetical protein
MVLWLFLAGDAAAEDPVTPVVDQAKSAEPAKVKAESEAAAIAQDDEEFELPPGFKARKRGDITVYCIKGKSTGTRFDTESCYDKQQLKDYLLAREQNNADFNRSRAVCSTAAICAP